MEDFGYSKEQEENYIKSLIKKSFLIGASLFSVFCFIYISMSAFNYFSQNHSDIKIIEPPVENIKIIAVTEVQNEDSMKIDSSIYEDIFGTRKKEKRKIKVKKPAIAPIAKKTKEDNIITKNKSSNDKKIIIYSDEKLTKNIKTLSSDNNKSKQKTGKNYVRVQIAAMTSKRSAYRYFESLKNNYPNLFQGLEHFIQEVDLGKRGTFYRVQIGNFYDQIRAENFCQKFVTQTSKSKADCIIVE